MKQTLKHTLVLLTILLTNHVLVAQERGAAASKQIMLDTVLVYDCKYRIVQEGSSKTYSINGQSVTEQEFQKVGVGFKKRANCNPCYLKQISMDEKLVAEGIYYHVCYNTVADEEGEVLREGKDSKTMLFQNRSCKEGLWIYYGKNGELVRKEKYEAGKLVE